MKAIVCVDKNWAIGLKNKLLVSIPDDMRFFRQETMGKVVIMGRRTLESFPGGKPLKGRVNIVLSASGRCSPEGAVVVRNTAELEEKLRQYNTDDVYIIGGESVYRRLIDLCDTAYVTRIDYAYEADAYFPNLDENPDWKVAEVSEEQTYFDLTYHFYTYEKS